MNKKMNELLVVSIRLVSEPPYLSSKPILNPEDAIHIIGNMLEDWDRECLIVVNQNSSGKPINMNIDITKKILEVGKLLDIYLTDHIILGKNQEYLSLRKENYIEKAAWQV